MRYLLVILVAVLAPVCAMAQPTIHSADQDGDNVIGLMELLRVIQLFNLLGIHCDSSTEDGYAPGWIDTPPDCGPHSSDYNPMNWRIELGELLRIIQFFNLGGYHVCAEGEDGFCPGLGPEVETVLLANWLGYDVVVAQPAIEAQGLVVSVSYEYDEDTPAGIITGQGPIAGLVPLGYTVDLMVSNGPDPNQNVFEATLETTDPDTIWVMNEIGHFRVTVSGGVPPYRVVVNWPDASLQSMDVNTSGGETTFSRMFGFVTEGSANLLVRVKDSSSPQQILDLSIPFRVDMAPVE